MATVEEVNTGSYVASKLYGVNATIIILVLYCIVLCCIVLYCIILYFIVTVEGMNERMVCSSAQSAN